MKKYQTKLENLFEIKKSVVIVGVVALVLLVTSPSPVAIVVWSLCNDANQYPSFFISFSHYFRFYYTEYSFACMFLCVHVFLLLFSVHFDSLDIFLLLFFLYIFLIRCPFVSSHEAVVFTRFLCIYVVFFLSLDSFNSFFFLSMLFGYLIVVPVSLFIFDAYTDTCTGTLSRYTIILYTGWCYVQLCMTHRPGYMIEYSAHRSIHRHFVFVLFFLSFRSILPAILILFFSFWCVQRLNIQQTQFLHTAINAHHINSKSCIDQNYIISFCWLVFYNLLLAETRCGGQTITIIAENSPKKEIRSEKNVNEAAKRKIDANNMKQMMWELYVFWLL